MAAISLTVTGPQMIRIESEAPVTISIEPLTGNTAEAAVLPFPSKGGPSSGNPDDYEPNPR